MSVLKKKMISFRDILYICAMLHSYPSFNTCVECTLVVKPENVAAVSGERVTLKCASDVSKGNVAWSTLNPGSSDKDYIYIGGSLGPSVSSYISVSEKDDGSCSLHVNTSTTAAKRYICAERDSGVEASAELIVLKNHAECNYDNKTATVTCFATFLGNWAPNLECEQWDNSNNYSKKVVLEGTKTNAVNNNLVTSTWTYTGKNAEYDIYCSMEFEKSERPTETSATNVPNYYHTILAYHYIAPTPPAKSDAMTTPGSFRPNPDGVIVSIILNVLLLVAAALILLFILGKLMKKRRKVKKKPEEETQMRGGQYVNEA